MSTPVTVPAVQVIIDLSITTKVSKVIWPWELSVYQEKFGEGACIEKGTVECKKVLPDAAEEFSKLSASLGADEDTKTPFVELAYGRGKSGIKSLEKAILKSTKKPKAKEKAKKKVAAKKSEPESTPKQDASRDPLG